jgi:2-polyprenyl-6-methoxyphenol hydroxylase-like FAD-dependent oxidoreductase
MTRIDRQRIYWFATANAPAGVVQSAVERKRFLQRRFAGWHPPIEAWLDATPADEIRHNDIYDMAPLRRWSKDRVLLLGDAAHPTTPNMGQGACMAIESAVTLARCLAEEGSL